MTASWITLLGATGSIGQNTLDVVARHPERYRIYALTGFTQIDELARLCRQFSPTIAVVPSDAAAAQLASLLLSSETLIQVGDEALCQVASAEKVDTVVAAIVGAAGLLPTLAAAKAGKKILLANKEALVMAGALLMTAVAQSGAKLLPLDSEHNAIFQCLPDGFSDLASAGITRLLLTGSGGPFRLRPRESLGAITPDEACAHPNWRMGRKISVDSATMMNKGLEFIEACWLFGARPEDIEVVLHPQSVVHSMVEYADGSVLCQMGCPDMRTPIAHCLAYPTRIASGAARLDFAQLRALEFAKPCLDQFPALGLAQAAMRQGGVAPAVLNAANEEAVTAFLANQLPFLAITDIVAQVLAGTSVSAEPLTLEAVLAADRDARIRARHCIAHHTPLTHHAPLIGGETR